MKLPNLRLNYPNGNKFLEVIEVEGDVFEAVQMGTGLLSIATEQIPKLQPLVTQFYNIWQNVKTSIKENGE